MKLITFRNKEGLTRAGWLKEDAVVDMNLVSNGKLPADMLSFIVQARRIFFDYQRIKIRRAIAHSFTKRNKISSASSKSGKFS